MSYVTGRTVRGRENRAIGSPALRENATVGVQPPKRPIFPGATATNTGYVPAASVTSITESGGIATLTRTAHACKPGDIIRLAGANEALYNGDFHVLTVPTSATLTFHIKSGYGNASGTLTMVRFKK